MITRLNPNNLPPMVRERNKGLMTAFISAHLPSRVGLDTRRSVVLYDRNFLFNYALEGLPNERTIQSCITNDRFGIGRKEFDLTNGIPCEECYEQPRQGDMAGVRALCSDCIEDHPAENDRE